MNKNKKFKIGKYYKYTNMNNTYDIIFECIEEGYTPRCRVILSNFPGRNLYQPGHIFNLHGSSFLDQYSKLIEFDDEKI